MSCFCPVFVRIWTAPRRFIWRSSAGSADRALYALIIAATAALAGGSKTARSGWKEDARAILDHLLPQGRKAVLVGSSMGGWIALLLAKECPERLAGLIGLAAAPDFTREIEAEMNAGQKEEMAASGLISVANDYSDEPYIFTKALIDDGRENLF